MEDLKVALMDFSLHMFSQGLLWVVSPAESEALLSRLLVLGKEPDPLSESPFQLEMNEDEWIRSL